MPRSIRRVVLALLVGATALSGLGLSVTFYACPMQAAPSARPCCPDVAGEPAGADTVSRTPCCRPTHVEVAAAPSDSRRASPEALLAPVAVAIVPATAPTPRAAAASPLARPARTHGPPPLERSTRLLI